MSDNYHAPVQLHTALQHLLPSPGGVFLDATLGGGGYSEALLKAGGPTGRVIGIDRDPEALEFASARLEKWGDRFTPVHGNFAEIRRLLNDLDVGRVDGAVFDLGVSSHQLDEVERGFSFQRDAPLDMRMDRSTDTTAADLVSTRSIPWI